MSLKHFPLLLRINCTFIFPAEGFLFLTYSYTSKYITDLWNN